MVRCGVLSYLWCNFTRFIISRPPVAIVLLFIGTLSICFYTLSIYVQTYQIVDEESTSKLSNVLDSLLLITFCLDNNTVQLNASALNSRIKSFGDTEFVNLSFPLLATFSASHHLSKVYPQVTKVDALLPYFLLHKDDNHLHSIPLGASLTTPLISERCSNCQIETCVTIQVKKDFAPYGISYKSCLSKGALTNQTVFMHHLKSEKGERSLCSSPDLQLKFEKQDKFYKPYVYLNMWLKSKVNVRLHAASYIFFVLLLSCVIYAMMKGRAMNTVSSLKAMES